MKTAREYIMEANEGYDFYTVIGNLTEDQILDAMKEYAKKVAEQALKDASENVYHTFEIDWNDPYDYSAGQNGIKGEIDLDSIILTPIQLP